VEGEVDVDLAELAADRAGRVGAERVALGVGQRAPPGEPVVAADAREVRQPVLGDGQQQLDALVEALVRSSLWNVIRRNVGLTRSVRATRAANGR
jgi:hypothetical protein